MRVYAVCDVLRVCMACNISRLCTLVSNCTSKSRTHFYNTLLTVDDFHPASNKAKMSAGIPLTDEDRIPCMYTYCFLFFCYCSVVLNGSVSLFCACMVVCGRVQVLTLAVAFVVVLVYRVVFHTKNGKSENLSCGQCHLVTSLLVDCYYVG